MLLKSFCSSFLLKSGFNPACLKDNQRCGSDGFQIKEVKCIITDGIINHSQQSTFLENKISWSLLFMLLSKVVSVMPFLRFRSVLTKYTTLLKIYCKKKKKKKFQGVISRHSVRVRRILSTIFSLHFLSFSSTSEAGRDVL